MKKWQDPTISNLSIINTNDQQMYCKNCCVAAIVIGDNNGTEKKWQCPTCGTTAPKDFKGNNNGCTPGHS